MKKSFENLGWTCVEIKHINFTSPLEDITSRRNMINNAMAWCEENITKQYGTNGINEDGHLWTNRGRHFYFQSPGDAMMFKLVWG